MNVVDIPIADIVIGERRREDFGDMEAFAANIAERSLIHPITVAPLPDGKYKLAAGERRIRAFVILGRTEIPARIYDELSEDERLLIELEENLFRKDLTPYEQSKNLVALAQTAEKVITSELRPNPGQKSTEPKKGRPEQPASLRKVAERIGVPKSTVQEARAHVAAVEKYPEVKDAPKEQAIQTAKTLDSLKPEKREQVRADSSKLKAIVNKSSIPKPSKSSPLSPVQEFIHTVKSKGGIVAYSSRMNQQEQFTFRDNIASCRDELDSFVSDLTDFFDDVRDEASGF